VIVILTQSNSQLKKAKEDPERKEKAVRMKKEKQDPERKENNLQVRREKALHKINQNSQVNSVTIVSGNALRTTSLMMIDLKRFINKV
jgi:uncharacterized protein YlxW (UPF0749 family)